MSSNWFHKERIRRGAARASALGLLVATVLLGVRSAQATQPRTPAESYQHAKEALDNGRLDEAIAGLESLADQGFVHPDASFQRAFAYQRRAATPQARPSDVGQAIAALEEARRLRPDDELFESVLTEARETLVRAQARRGLKPVQLPPSLLFAWVEFFPRGFWWPVGLAGLAALALGLGVRWRSLRSELRFTGTLAAFIGGGVACLGVGGVLLAEWVRGSYVPAVVVAESVVAQAPGATGKRVTVPAGTVLWAARGERASEIGAQGGSGVLVAFGREELLLPPTALRTLQSPPAGSVVP